MLGRWNPRGVKMRVKGKWGRAAGKINVRLCLSELTTVHEETWPFGRSSASSSKGHILPSSQSLVHFGEKRQNTFNC